MKKKPKRVVLGEGMAVQHDVHSAHSGSSEVYLKVITKPIPMNLICGKKIRLIAEVLE